jgi:hypothetical protein
MKRFIQPRCYSKRTRRGRLKLPDRRWKHGLFPKINPDPIYVAWLAMTEFCTGNSGYAIRYYKNREIRVCRAWQTFAGFRKWAIRKFRPGLYLVRRDKNKDYCPSNCLWDSFKKRVPVRCRETAQEFATFREAAAWLKVDPGHLRKRVYQGYRCHGYHFDLIPLKPDLRRAKSFKHFK